MKWTIHELIRIYNQDNTFEGDIDFSDWIEKTDIIRISMCHVEGDFETSNITTLISWVILNIDNTSLMSGSNVKNIGINLLKY